MIADCMLVQSLETSGGSRNLKRGFQLEARANFKNINIHELYDALAHTLAYPGFTGVL